MSALSALLHASTGSGAQRLTALEAAIRTPLPLRRSIGVVSATRRSGCSTVSLALAELLSRMRTQPVHLVHRGRVRSDPPRPAIDSLVQQHHEGRGEGDGDWGSPTEVSAEVRHELSVLDHGATALADLPAVIEDVHALCLVASAEREEIQVAYDRAHALRRTLPVLLVVDDAHDDAVAATGPLIEHLPLQTVLIPHAPAGRRSPLRLTGRPARELLQGGAHLVTGLAGGPTTSEVPR